MTSQGNTSKALNDIGKWPNTHSRSREIQSSEDTTPFEVAKNIWEQISKLSKGGIVIKENPAIDEHNLSFECSNEELQEMITNSIKTQYDGPAQTFSLYSKPYTKRIDNLRMPHGYQPPKFQQFNGKDNPKQHGIKPRTFEELVTIAHDVELSIANRGNNDLLVPKKKKKEVKSTQKVSKDATKEAMVVSMTLLKFVSKEKKVEKWQDEGEKRCLTLKERQEKIYPFPDSYLSDMLDHLLEKQLIQLPECKQPAEMGRVNDPNYCKYHWVVNHPVEKCFVLKELILKLALDKNIELDLDGYVWEQKLNQILIGNGSAVNILLKSTMNQLGISKKELSNSKLVIQGFNQGAQGAMGTVHLEITIRDLQASIIFHKIRKVDADTKPFSNVESYFANAKFYTKSDDAKHNCKESTIYKLNSGHKKICLQKVKHVVLSGMKRKMFVSVNTEDSLKVKRHDVVFNRPKDNEPEDEVDVASSCHVTVEETSDHDTFEEDAEVTPLSLGTIEEPHPTFINAQLSNDDENKIQSNSNDLDDEEKTAFRTLKEDAKSEESVRVEMIARSFGLHQKSYQNAFDNIKKYLLNPFVLSAPAAGKLLILYIAAQETSLGALLAQENDKVRGKASNLKPYFIYARRLMNRFDDIILEHIPRSRNKKVDAFANFATALTVSVDVPINIFLCRKWIVSSIKSQYEEADVISVYAIDEENWRRKEESTKALEEAYSGICGAHQSSSKLQHRLKRMGYYWPTMIHDSMHFAKYCEAYQFHANFIHHPLESFHPTISSWPFEAWRLDLLGLITPKSLAGHSYILAGTDCFSK
ncbi:ty3-gypsy retrotransposon protein [Cucumis melo var. makuwa]|uniref:Ty3-gypsy retrotransposon protein n=1 Tax=Cucumis melo var. makuwa TaxID=1194695 RepID=A0A5A7UYH7_CUCMM|nr:ty3-gypsy retrotransposon protein [Cucumis melo var. makuwa]TYK07214.1 ty3-gypsy retrotransposon protein [Cucumis melo var. makuwa]